MPTAEVDAVLLALKKTGGSADAGQLSMTTGLPRGAINRRLAQLHFEGRIRRDGDHWRLVQTI